MVKFALTAIRDHGLPYWMASYPKDGPVGPKGSTGRAQRKFRDKEPAERFLEGQKKRYEERWRIGYWIDARIRNDVASALGTIAGVRGGTLTAAARVYVECIEANERVGARAGYRELGKRQVELSGRLVLGLEGVARRYSMAVEDLISASLWAVVEKAPGEAAAMESAEEGYRGA